MILCTECFKGELITEEFCGEIGVCEACKSEFEIEWLLDTTEPTFEGIIVKKIK